MLNELNRLAIGLLGLNGYPVARNDEALMRPQNESRDARRDADVRNAAPSKKRGRAPKAASLHAAEC